MLASVDREHAGIASAVNNALSRLGQMIAVAVLPLTAGLAGAAFTNPAVMAAGFPIAMTVAAATSFAAALLAWTTIRSDALGPRGIRKPLQQLPPALRRHCAVAGTPLTSQPGEGLAAAPHTAPDELPGE